MSTPRLPGRVAVVGAGTMGAGIAAVFARAGCTVRLAARRETSRATALERASQIAGDAAAATIGAHWTVISAYR